MANRAVNGDRSFGASDRERQRDVINEPGRNSSPMSASNIGGTINGGRKSARGFASMDESKQK